MADATPVADPGFLAGKRILVVEDEFFIVLDIERILEDAKVEIVGTSRNRDALAALAGGRFDLAILDYKLSEATSEPVAEQLTRLKVPFVFLTGASTQSVPPQYRTVPLVKKPFDGAALIAALQKAIGRG